MSLILGLDPSLTCTGWALLDSEKKECPNWGLIKTTTKDLNILRFLYIKKELTKIVQQYPIDRVGCEAPVFGGYETGTLFTIYILFQEVLLKNKLDVVFFAPSQIHSQLRGEGYGLGGKIYKADSVQAAKDYLKDLPSKASGDKADAFHAARLGSRFWDFFDGKLTLDDLDETEKNIFAKQHTFVRGKKKGITEKKGIIFRENELFFRFSKITF